jgi:RIP metalloprotease RseP
VPDNQVPKPETAAAEAPSSDSGDAPETPLTPAQWLTQNFIYLAILVGGLIWLYRAHGWEGLPSAFLTVFGIGFIIFIHELGHFLVAKWCDVHVLTFSIGFGPAIPGCSFKRGETTYKLALLPLGGYVNMVGEGADADEGEDYPRSFKNKTVGQRMAIISAGVIMNVILGAIAFTFVYRVHGVNQLRATVGRTEPGGVAWSDGVRSGWRIDQIGSNEKPNFKDLQSHVALNQKGVGIPFVFWDPATEKTISMDLKAERLPGEDAPRIGIAGPMKLSTPKAESKNDTDGPFAPNSPAAVARVLDLQSGDVVLSATDPDDPANMSALRQTNWAADLASRMVTLRGSPMTLKVRRKGGAEEETNFPAAGFKWGDTIVGSSVPATKDYDPFRVSELPLDPRIKGTTARDPFEFFHRMRLLAGKPAIIQVKRDGSEESDSPVNVFVPPAYQPRFGARMLQLAVVAALRAPAKVATDGKGNSRPVVEVGDKISGVRIEDEAGNYLLLGDAPKNSPVEMKPKPLDPVRLPFELAQFAAAHPNKKYVTLTVIVPNPQGKDEGTARERILWDDSWDDNLELPQKAVSPLSIPQLGIAYWVKGLIDFVEPGSPAADARRVQEQDGVWTKVKDPLQKGDKVLEIRYWDSQSGTWIGRGNGKGKGKGWYNLREERKNDDSDTRWGWAFVSMHEYNTRIVQLMIRRDTKLIEEPFEVVLEDDPRWPASDRGLLLLADTHVVKADSMLEALNYGKQETLDFISMIYQGLHRLITGRISTETLEGPIGIVSTTFGLARHDIYGLILFLGVLSVNLAVVNFLPIPLLDGGHMVFLIYEKIRGKPASEQVRNIAAIIGLVLLLMLMAYVIFIDIQRRIL